MTERTGGSPEYLTLLSTIRWPEATPPTWRYLDQRWRHLTIKQSQYNLKELARVAFALVAHETNSTLDYILEAAARQHVGKNAGYAGADQPDPWANFRLSTAFAITPFEGVLVRMSDKYIRTVNLRRDPSNERIGEPLVDTLFDLGAYALIAVCLQVEELADVA